MRDLFFTEVKSVANVSSNTFRQKMPGYPLKQMAGSISTVYGFPVL